MKKKALLFLLLPLTLASCGNGGVSFATIKAIIDNIPADPEPVFPYYHVSGMIDYNGITANADYNFVNSPSDEKFVPFARYNEGFYNSAADSAVDEENVIMYAMGSRSYWLRAPLRITSDNFYDTIASNNGSGSFNGVSFSVKYDTGRIGAIGEKISNAYISFDDPMDIDKITLKYTKDDVSYQLDLNRTSEVKQDTNAIYNGTYLSTFGDVLILKQTETENPTCAHGILKTIITSYDTPEAEGTSTNPSTSKITYEALSNGGFAFAGYSVHTKVLIDNFPYYPSPELHPEIGEWDPDDPLQAYKSICNSKVNIRFEYNKDGWLVKESMTSTSYDYKVTKPGQVSLISVYTYKFSDD